jgi:hypothetical protein
VAGRGGAWRDLKRKNRMGGGEKGKKREIEKRKKKCRKKT